MAFSLAKLFGSKENKFFDLFDQSAENLVLISSKFSEMLRENDPQKVKNYVLEIEDLEHVGDKITHTLFNELNRTFITPLDREDINDLASSIDNIVDNIHGSAKRITIYKVEVISEEMQKLGELIKEAAIHVRTAVNGMRNMKNTEAITEACIKINSIENQADDIFDNAIGKLFHTETDAIQLIKYKEVLSTMETATDMCEDASDTIRGILIKYA